MKIAIKIIFFIILFAIISLSAFTVYNYSQKNMTPEDWYYELQYQLNKNGVAKEDDLFQQIDIKECLL